MKVEFAILAPQTGGYIRASSLDEAAEAMAQEALSFYLEQCHQTPLSIVCTNDDGSEAWKTAEGEDFPPISSVLSAMVLKAKNITSMQQAQQIDITKLGGA